MKTPILLTKYLLPSRGQSVLVSMMLACFATVPMALAINPAPDGCYPGLTTAEGCHALAGLGSGQGNTGLGWYALAFADAASYNTAVGAGALALNTGDSNTAVGTAALLLNTTGVGNVAVGTRALVNNTTASDNVAIGDNALANNMGGVLNTIVGTAAGQNIVNAGDDGNIYIGAGVNGFANEFAIIRIGIPVFENVPYDTFIAGIFDRPVDVATARLVYADANQKIGTVLLDADGTSVPFKPQAVLDESLKQQKRIAELEATVERQQKEMEMLTAQLKEQAAQIQRVSAQIDLNGPVLQTVRLPVVALREAGDNR